MQTDEPSRDELPHSHSFPPVVVGVADHEPRQNEEEIDGQIAVVDSLIDVTCRKGFEHVKPDDHQRRYAAQSVEYVVVGFRICKCRRRDFCFRHGWLFLLLFGVNWLFTGCKYTKSAVQIGHEPHFSSLLPYFAGFAARFRRPLCCPLPSSVSARPLAPLPFASAAPAPVSRPPASRPCSASLLCVPALRSGPARFPVACSALYPARPRSACRASGLLLPVPQGQLLQYRHHTVRQGRHRPLVVVAG